jgi:amidase
MATFPEYESFDALGLARLVQRGVMSAAELLEAAIERAEALNPQINAINYPMYDLARAQVSGKLAQGAFAGVPFLLKDLLADYAGVPLSSGSRFTQHWTPTRDSDLVQRIKRAGLIVFGKTNVPEFGLSSVTEPVLFGPTRNPWNLAHSSGGSSGGAAAAVAAGIVPMAHGNDGGGSIRIPASYCGLFGLKPSRGRTAVGSEILRMWESMVAEHVLTRSVRDSAAMLDVLTTPTLANAGLKQHDTFLNSLDKRFPKLQIAFTTQPFFPSNVDPEYSASLNQAAKLCQQLGHSVEEVSLKINSTEVARAYVTVIAGEISTSIKRFSESMGRKPKSRDLEKQTQLIRHIGDHIKPSDFTWARNVLEKASQSMQQFFKDYDVLITPTMPSAPPLIGALKPDFLEQGVLELLIHAPLPLLLQKAMEHAATKHFALYPFTPIFNVSGQPAMSVPLYVDSKGLPIGIQFAARFGEEVTLLQLAKQLEEVNPWFERKPERVDTLYKTAKPR